MRCPARIAIGIAVLLLVPLSLLVLHLEDLWNQYDVTAYVFTTYKTAWLGRAGSFTHKRPQASFNNSSDKVVVMAKLEAEDTDWVAEELSELDLSPQTPNPCSAVLTFYCYS